GDSSAYLDAQARRLVAAARDRRETIDRSITAYRTRMRERIGVGIRALRRDRMLYRREIALLIDWQRDSVTRIEVIGARQSVPAAVPKPSLPEDLKGDARDYAFDPANDRLTDGSGADSSRQGRPLGPSTSSRTSATRTTRTSLVSSNRSAWRCGFSRSIMGCGRDAGGCRA